MIYDKWMSFLKDEIKLADAVIPAAHNSSTYRMRAPFCCQNGDFYDQFKYGVRYFTVRLDTDKNGEIVLCHGTSKGDSLENALKCLKRAIEETETEFFVLDIAPFEPQHVLGKFNLQFSADKDRVDRLLERYLEPSSLAYDGDVKNLTFGELRASGKRYILLNDAKEYRHSVYCPTLKPWNGIFEKIDFAKYSRSAVGFYDSYKIGGVFLFDARQASLASGKAGIRIPRRVDEACLELYRKIIENVANSPDLLSKANVLDGDFITEDYMKARNILLMNVLKDNIREDKAVEFVRRLWKSEK